MKLFVLRTRLRGHRVGAPRLGLSIPTSRLLMKVKNPAAPAVQTIPWVTVTMSETVPVRDDLLHAQASIDWAVAQFPSFRDRINLWLRKNIYVAIEDPDPNGPNDVVVAVEKEPFPLGFMVEAGAYINAIRSSLDILACALALRHGIPKPGDCYFPIAGSEAVFLSGGYKGVEFVKGLPQNERVKIESLKPYQGGNELLWSLHRLDIVRKHKRLIEPAIRP